jgi:LmbE family N-acetylglucosaminyl deacetylase
MHRFKGKKVLYISSHLDDAVLSSGGMIRMIRGECSNFVLVNVFTESVWMVHQNAAVTEAFVSHLRKEEDRRYCQELKIDAFYLGFKDSSLRGYDEVSEITTQIEPVIYNCVKERLYKLLPALSYDYIISPLGIGSHVDHIILFEIMKEWNDKRIIFYEDLPYASYFTSEDLLWIVKQKLGADYYRKEININQVYDQKNRDIQIYSSQVEAMTLEWVRNYSYRDDHTQAVERIWIGT